MLTGFVACCDTAALAANFASIVASTPWCRHAQPTHVINVVCTVVQDMAAMERWRHSDEGRAALTACKVQFFLPLDAESARLHAQQEGEAGNQLVVRRPLHVAPAVDRSWTPRLSFDSGMRRSMHVILEGIHVSFPQMRAGREAVVSTPMGMGRSIMGYGTFIAAFQDVDTHVFRYSRYDSQSHTVRDVLDDVPPDRQWVVQPHLPEERCDVCLEAYEDASDRQKVTLHSFAHSRQAPDISTDDTVADLTATTHCVCRTCAGQVGGACPFCRHVFDVTADQKYKRELFLHHWQENMGDWMASARMSVGGEQQNDEPRGVSYWQTNWGTALLDSTQLDIVGEDENAAPQVRTPPTSSSVDIGAVEGFVRAIDDFVVDPEVRSWAFALAGRLIFQ